jgi:hypothetical protein
MNTITETILPLVVLGWAFTIVYFACWVEELKADNKKLKQAKDFLAEERRRDHESIS